MTKTTEARTVRLDVASRFDMLEVVQTVLAHLSSLVGFDDDATHYLSVALRESMVNAIKHGNRLDDAKRVHVVFHFAPKTLEVEVRDEGTGFDPGGVADPLAPENLLKADGRGIFFMRSFMDDVSYAFPKEGGTVVRMRKTLP
jgi:serine/threonine-protein kinase RsbW